MTTLFPPDAIDRPALDGLAGRAVPRTELQGRYVPVAKSTDLFDVGYTVLHWIIPGVPGSELLEYLPRSLPDRACVLPRLTADSYADQVAIHEAIGARVVSPGRRFSR